MIQADSTVCLMLQAFFTRILFERNKFILNHKIPTSNDDLKKNGFKNILDEGENAGNQHFLLFQQCFLFYRWQVASLRNIFTQCFLPVLRDLCRINQI